MPGFRFVPSNRFARTDAESGQRFASFLIDEQSKALDAQSKALAGVADVEKAISDQIADIQGQIEDAASADAEWQKKTADEQADLDKKLTDAIEKLSDRLSSFLTDLHTQVKVALDAIESRSAGGILGGITVDKRVGTRTQAVTGTPRATSEFRFVGFGQGQVDENSWLYCDGTTRKITDYGNLYACIGNYYNTSAPAGYFALPTQAQCPGGATGGGAWWIRT